MADGPGTLGHFKQWARGLVLDNGKPWEVEDFQLKILEDILGGYREVWTVIPEGNGKTTLWAGVALYHCDPDGWNVPSPFVPIAASSREQAEIMYRQAEGFVLRTPGMAARFTCQEGYRRIKVHSGATMGRIQVYAADDRTADGVIFTLALLDELHRHKNLRLYRTWVGKASKRGGQVAAISTAGEPGSEFEETRAGILNGAAKIASEGAHVRAEDGELVLHDFAVRDQELAGDMKAVAAANPRKSINQTLLTKKRASKTMTDAHWLRFVCNIAVSTTQKAIKAEEWDACKGEVDLDEASEVYLGVDIGQVQDASAVAQAGWVGDKLHIRCRIWEPLPGQPVSIGEVEAHVLELGDLRSIAELAYDPFRFQRSAEVLEERGIMVAEFPQTDIRMNQASNVILDLVRSGRVVHDGDPLLRAHALSAIATETDRGWRISKKKSGKTRIDGLIAVAMAAQRAMANAGPSDRPSIEVLA